MKMATKRLTRAGIIAALYTALTYAFAPLAFGGLQVRPAEALCLLPLFFPEAIPALTIGCILSNLTSPYLFYDVIFGSGATLVASVCTYFIGRAIKKERLRIAVGGIFPVLVNAIVLPFILTLLSIGGSAPFYLTYLYFALSVALCQTVWVYGLGVPVYFAVKKLKSPLD